MALARIPRSERLIGRDIPRNSPPIPLHHGLKGYRAAAKTLDIKPMPWQDTAAKYLTARADDHWLYREVLALVGRQNGKTTLVKPLILDRLKAGRHVMHIAQVRELPRIMFEQLADALERDGGALFPRRRGKIIWPRRGAGSESIVLSNGGSYRIAAAVSGSARGHSIDDLIIDELREMESFDVINSAKPTQRFSRDPQTIYLSNEGTDKALVLDSLRLRARQGDERLAFLDWSAAPERAVDDRDGWAEANPAIGHFDQVLRDLEADYVAALLGGNMAGFETEALCRRVITMRDSLVDMTAWHACIAEPVPMSSPCLGVSLDPERHRASAAIAWLREDGVGLTVIADVSADTIDTDALGQELRKQAGALGVRRVAYDPLTDGELAKYFKKPTAINGQAFANACSQFAGLVAAQSLRHHDAKQVGDDLTWTARKLDHETGRFEAVRAQDDRPITAALAAIRAVWLASGLRLARPRVM